MSSPIRIRAKARDGVTEVMVLMPHPMETGLRADGSGEPVAAHHITDVHIAVGERTVLEARLSIAVSKDPLLSFRFDGGNAGERIRVTWQDNRGERRMDEAPIT